MTRSSPMRRIHLASSPERLCDFLSEDRNTQSSHFNALVAAQAEHDRVRTTAIRVFELHELREEHQRILDEEHREEERLKAEAEIAAEQQKLQKLKAQTIPKPPPVPSPSPEPQKPQVQSPKPQKTVSNKEAPEATQAPAVVAVETNGTPEAQKNASSQGAPSALKSAQAETVSTQAQARPQAQQFTTNSTFDRYLAIHKELKTLRTALTNESKNPASPLHGKLGTLRREVRVAIGQLTGVKGANTNITTKITGILKGALDGQVPSPSIDVARFVLEPSEPVQGAINNEPTMPALLIYLLNICSKAIINQFINECGANPKAADPIGIFTAQIFGTKEFQWRDNSLIDILMSKFRVVCPVLFGVRGNEKSDKGRLAIGWRKDGPSWISEQSHQDRMTGLGAGFASISLRDFSRSHKKNPYPPRNYWKAFAAIVNSPIGETCNTQCIVLKFMISGYEQRFLGFYGNAGVAALRKALVDFPRKIQTRVSAAMSLTTLADLLRTESGLILE